MPALNPQVNLENSTGREERAAFKQQEIRTWRVECNGIMGDAKKEIIRLRKGLQNEESTDGSWKVCLCRIPRNCVKVCAVVVSKMLGMKLQVKD